MEAAAILSFEKNANISGLDADMFTKFGGQMRHGHVEMIAWAEIETGS